MLTLLRALWPLCLSALAAVLTTQGYLNLGAGEKDIFLVVPAALWSLIFLVAYLLAARRALSPWRATRRAALQASVALLLVLLALFVVSLLR